MKKRREKQGGKDDIQMGAETFGKKSQQVDFFSE